ncbi:META domain-containing protein [Pseudomonas sp.]|uniref:META domain-containing protein n=1 Tax=Pseudomonas sp. TaxID=306 RepID=UPI00272BE5B2|nr:META domain-containing protein [Pseudomonas sp.]
MKNMLHWLCLLAPWVLAGCSEPARDEPGRPLTTPESEEHLELRGSLNYNARIALQPESEAIVELVRLQVEAEPNEQTVADQQIGLVGRQVPINFTLEVPRSLLGADERYELRARIRESGKVSWQADALPLGTLEESLDLGELVLLPARSAGFSSILECGQLQISAGYEGADLILQVAGDRYRMLPVRSASGARFEAEGDPSTRFSSKGENALLVLQGQPYPECVPPGLLPQPFTARGNEPFWDLTMEHQQLSLNRIDEQLLDAAPYEAGVADSNSQSYMVDADPPVEVEVHREVCYDSMTGIPYPARVEVKLADAILQGCGGQPERLLQGVEWVFEEIAGDAPLTDSRVSLIFYPNNRFAGQASCNNLMGEYELTGEALTLSRAVTTRKACSAAVMEQEVRFVDTLERVRGFAFADDGSLMLLTRDEEILKARRD